MVCMRIIEKNLDAFNLPTISTGSFTLLDIETSGFNRVTDTIIIVGLLEKLNSGLKITQFLAESPAEEYQLLEALSQREFHQLYTYNGTQFDLPFLEKKYHLHRLNNPFTKNHVDFYPKIKAYQDILPSSSLKQSALEEWIGLSRPKDIPSHEIPRLYYESLKHPENKLLEPILDHNSYDLIGLYHLLHFENYLQEWMTYKDASLSFSLNKPSQHEDWLTLSGRLLAFDKPLISINRYEEYYQFQLDASTGHFQYKFLSKEYAVEKNTFLRVTDLRALGLNQLSLENNLHLPNHIMPLKYHKKYLIPNLKLLMANALQQFS